MPQGAVAMSRLFAAMQESAQRLRIADWGVTHPSLEAVFLQVVAATEKEVRSDRQPLLAMQPTPANLAFSVEV